MKQTHKEEETERKTHKDDVNDHKNTKSSLLLFVNFFFPSRELNRLRDAKRTEFASSRAANVIHFEIRFEVIHRQTVTSHRRFSVVVFIRVDGVGDVSVRVLEDFSHALRDVLRIIIRLIKLLFVLREGIFQRFVRHVVQNGTPLTPLKDFERLRAQSTTETRLLRASKKSASR